jgi:hypothetical protein
VRAHFAALAQWAATYEDDVCTRLGSAWRHECANRRPREQRHRLPVQPDLLAQSWLALRDELTTFLPLAAPPPTSLAS